MAADVNIPISPELQAACDAMPKAHLTYIVTAYGKPRSKFGLGNDFDPEGYFASLIEVMSEYPLWAVRRAIAKVGDDNPDFPPTEARLRDDSRPCRKPDTG